MPLPLPLRLLTQERRRIVAIAIVVVIVFFPAVDCSAGRRAVFHAGGSFGGKRGRPPVAVGGASPARSKGRCPQVRATSQQSVAVYRCGGRRRIVCGISRNNGSNRIPRPGSIIRGDGAAAMHRSHGHRSVGGKDVLPKPLFEDEARRIRGPFLGGSGRSSGRRPCPPCGPPLFLPSPAL